MESNSPVPDRRSPTAARTAYASPGVTASSLRRRLWAGDALAFGTAWSVVWLVGAPPESGGPATRLLGLVGIVTTGLVACSIRGLYRTGIASVRAVAYARLMSAAGLSGLAAVLLEKQAGRESWLARPAVGAALAFVLAATTRYIFDWTLRHARGRGSYARPITVVGTVEEVQGFAGFVASNPELGYVVASVVGCEHDPGLGVPWHPRVADARIAVTTSASTAAIVFASGLSVAAGNDLVRELVAARIPVQLHSGLLGVSYRRLRPTPIGHEPFFQVTPSSESMIALAAKRVLDIVGSSVLLVLTAPVLCAAALAIKLHDGGEVFFRQTRVGRNGKPIRVHKLRTMAADAEARLAEVQPLNERMGPLFKTESDPRVTTVGRIMRRTSIDEIPQLFDVLRGDMSLVGPRPALPEEVAAFDDALLGRLRVRPGVTGLWQVEARQKPSFEAYRRLDLFYVENWSIALDLAILVDTIPAVLGYALLGRSRHGRALNAVASTTLPFVRAGELAAEGESLSS